MREYTKPPLSLDDQVQLLKSRGLIISDSDGAKLIMSQLNYYRLSAYCLPFERSRHVFKSGVSIESVKALYEFDRCLRFLIDEALEVIEISLRSKIAYFLSRKYGAFAHEERPIFFEGKHFNHAHWLAKVHEEVDRSKETFVQHYKHTYLGFPKIPIWMAVEVMSFGSLSKIFHNLMKENQIEIAKEYSLNHRVLASWLHTFTYVRNICAHHGRLWNKELAIKMETPVGKVWAEVNPKRIMSVLFAIFHMLKSLNIDPGITNKWHDEINQHLSSSIINDGLLYALGTNDSYKEHILWKL